MVTVPVPARADVQNLRSVGVPGKPLGQPPIQECVARYSSSDANHLKVPSSGSSPCPHCDPSWGKNWVCSHGFPALLLSLWSHIQFVVERKTRQRLHWSHRAVQWQTSADNRDRHQQVSLNVVCMDWGSFLIQQENKYRVKPLWETEMLVLNYLTIGHLLRQQGALLRLGLHPLAKGEEGKEHPAVTMAHVEKKPAVRLGGQGRYLLIIAKKKN